jgi:hypothetical protein
MRVLILVLYNETEKYRKMLEIQKYYKNIFADLNTIFDIFFISYNPKQERDIIIENDMIYLKGEEIYLDMTRKTIDALNYLIKIENKVYDYIVRTNISTIINYNNLYIFLQTLPDKQLYTGGLFETLTWLDYYSGINETTIQKYNLYNLHFIQGTSIIFSFDIANYFIENKNKLVYDIVDDVTLPLFLRDTLPDVYMNIEKYCNGFVSINKYDTNAVFIRNKHSSEHGDIITQMVDIIKEIIIRR